jgi:hypothetical protein
MIVDCKDLLRSCGRVLAADLMSRQMLSTRTLKSPDGRYEAVQDNFDEIRMGSPQFCRLEIRGSAFGVAAGRFAEPIAFSPDSRFLAGAELGDVVPDPRGRVIVFDFDRNRRIMVHAFTGFATGFTWDDDGTLSVTTWRHLFGEQSRTVWRAPALRRKHWWERLFHPT